MSARLEALGLLVGTIIGVGVFALPFVFFQAGFLLGAIELFLLTLAVLAIHLMYGDVALSTDRPHQLPGYASLYLGEKWKRPVTFISTLGLLGALIAYVILGGSFVENLAQYLFGSAMPGIGFLLFLILGFIVFFYDRLMAVEVESVLTLFLIATLALLVTLGFQSGETKPLFEVRLDNFALPYGVILFALAGTSVIPRVRQVLPGNGGGLGGVIIFGTLIPAFLYFLFAASVIMASAPMVSRESVSGLIATLGPGVVALGSLVGVLATVTSYIGVGLTFKSLLRDDSKFSPVMAWLVVSLLPPSLVLFGISDYIRVIGLMGTFMVGVEGLLIIKIWRSLPAPRIFRKSFAGSSYVLAAVFALGVLYEVVVFFS